MTTWSIHNLSPTSVYQQDLSGSPVCDARWRTPLLPELEIVAVDSTRSIASCSIRVSSSGVGGILPDWMIQMRQLMREEVRPITVSITSLQQGLEEERNESAARRATPI